MQRRRLGALLVVAAVSGLGAVAAIAGPGGGGTPAAASFRLEDGSAGCNYSASGEIACRTAGRPAAAVLSADGEARVEPDSAVGWDDSTPVLLAAESWWNGNVSCRVSGPRIVCSAGERRIAAGPAGVTTSR